MDEVTVAIYDERGARWAAEHRTVRPEAVRAVAERALPGVRADLGAGGGRYTALLGEPVVALDASLPMLDLIPAVAPGAMRVLGDLEALPFRHRSLAAGWANMSYLHVPRPRLPLALAQLHWAMQPGAPFEIQVLHGDQDYGLIDDDGVGGRLFAAWPEDRLVDVLTGAGFDVEGSGVDGDEVRVYGTRMLSLPDVVAPGMRVLVCGLNPSVFAAERGVGFARRSNRFWPCAVEAGLVSRPFDPVHALTDHAMGMTDIVKRATIRSSELDAAEYEAGLARVERLVAWLQPRVVCFVGLEGWRAAADPKAQPGPQHRPFWGRPVYLMPSTSGLNARTTRAELVTHLTTVRRLGMTSL